MWMFLSGGLSCAVAAQPQIADAAPHAETNLNAAAGQASQLPADPQGRSTVIGGRIHHLDRVRDQFVLQVYDGHSMKILYDPRTKLYRDGIPAPLSSLKSDERASVQTTLDGTKVFALSIHMLSKAPEGSCSGQVDSLNAVTGVLSVRCGLNADPVKFLLPNGVPVSRISQQQAVATPAAVSDLSPGTLVSVTFQSGSEGRAVAQQVDITATPGGSFVFRGALVFVDVHAGRLVVQDAKSDSNYSIAFSPDNFPASGDLHTGETVTVVANFDGTRYVATSISAQ